MAQMNGIEVSDAELREMYPGLSLVAALALWRNARARGRLESVSVCAFNRGFAERHPELAAPARSKNPPDYRAVKIPANPMPTPPAASVFDQQGLPRVKGLTGKKYVRLSNRPMLTAADLERKSA